MHQLTLADFKLETLRGVDGFFRVAQAHSGTWWLIDPRDGPFFGRAVDMATGRREGQEDPLGEIVAATERLRRWQFNTVGARAGAEFSASELPRTETVDFRRGSPVPIKVGGVALPDVFDPRWVQACDQRAAELCAPHRDDRELIGYFTDDELGWGQSFAPAEVGRPLRPSLLQVCLGLEPSFPAWHAAWEFALAPYGGDLETLARAWGVELPAKSALRALTQADEVLSSAAFMRDHDRFTREFARRYFTVSSAAIRRHDPHHLVLGCRFGSAPVAAVLEECTLPHVDVVSYGDFGAWEVASRDGETSGDPVWIGGFGWASPDFARGPLPDETEPLTRVERMLGHGRAALRELIEHPAVVGYAWRRWMDTPEEAPPFGSGLVHRDATEALEHTELLTTLNARADELRSASARKFSAPVSS